MIQFNLLPDVKREYVKTQRVKQLTLGISFIVSALALTVLVVLLLTVYVVQKKSIHDLNNDIQTNSNTLKNTPNLADILTVQSQLNSLSTLHQQEPEVSRLFGFLAELTPPQATISDCKADYGLDVITIDGNAPSLDVVNTFIDSLKFTSYTVQGSSGSLPAFSQVVLSGFTRNPTSATYSISLTFDPTIFNNTHGVTLTVGGQSQNSSQEPSIIFKESS